MKVFSFVLSLAHSAEVVTDWVGISPNPKNNYWGLAGKYTSFTDLEGQQMLRVQSTITVPVKLKSGAIYQSYFQIRDEEKSKGGKAFWESFTCSIQYDFLNRGAL